MTASKRKALRTKNSKNLKQIKKSGESETQNNLQVAKSNNESSITNNLVILKKNNKPLMEKRRRARINESLARLKDLVILESDKSVNPAKLEKADILELTVKHLKNLNTAESHEATRLFNSGFHKCLEETKIYLKESGNFQIFEELKAHLLLNLPSKFPHTTVQTKIILNDELIRSETDFNEPINLAMIRTKDRDNFSVWRPW